MCLFPVLKKIVWLTGRRQWCVALCRIYHNIVGDKRGKDIRNRVLSVWPVWLNGRAFVRDPKGRGFKSRPVRFHQVTALGRLLTRMCLCHQQYKLVPADGLWRSSARKVTAGLAANNGSLPPGGWLQVTCGLTTFIPVSAPGPTFGNEYGSTLPFYCQCSYETSNQRRAHD